MSRSWQERSASSSLVSSEKGRANWQFAWSSRKAASKESRQTASLPYPRAAIFILSGRRSLRHERLLRRCGVDFSLSVAHKSPHIENKLAWQSFQDQRADQRRERVIFAFIRGNSIS